MTVVTDILDFWFLEDTEARWFQSSPEFDREVIERFGLVHERAAAGDLDGWLRAPESSLALILALDQFPRNMFRGSARAFATDARAREAAEDAMRRRFDLRSEPKRRIFFYLPFQHSEDIDHQRGCVVLVRERANVGEYLDYAEGHLEVIERFGRFPYRNLALGRETTPEEAAYMKQGNGGY